MGGDRNVGGRSARPGVSRYLKGEIIHIVAIISRNLLECTHDWSVIVHDDQAVDVIYIDFYRAFDKALIVNELNSFRNFKKVISLITTS